ncbi:hypothetical protein TIFTF001_015304 [Ficus carica]|uniref:Uncharacterized protein n=1 Tax=Ficus carica TaxID=3494 RepID=A0AA88AHJ3_FICCA|nr:hypothetical protein TIFTF001_015304 [Ficus carica]
MLFRRRLVPHCHVILLPSARQSSAHHSELDILAPTQLRSCRTVRQSDLEISMIEHAEEIKIFPHAHISSAGKVKYEGRICLPPCKATKNVPQLDHHR